MSPNRGPLGTIVAIAATLLLLFGIFGCGSEDATAPETGFGTIEIQMPADTDGATWHLYGPGDSFQHGDTDLVLENQPAGQYTIIWTAVKNWTGPMPAVQTLKAGGTLTLVGDYLDKAPGSNYVRIENADFIMGSDDGTRKFPNYRDTTITRIDDIDDSVDPPDTFWVTVDTTVTDTLTYPAEIGRDQDEARHRVTISYAHYVAKTEVTNQEFVELGNWALTNGAATATESNLLDNLDNSRVELINFDFEDTPIDIQDGMLRLKKPEYANRPIIEVTWYGAASYCDWLSLQEGVARAYDHDTWELVSPNYRLPTEAEWENSCRAGTTTGFSSGEVVDGACNEPALEGAGWYCGNAEDHSYDVGTKAANPWGLFDMHGNVWEWCHDYYAKYFVPDLPLDPDSPDPNNPRPLLFYDDEDLTPVEDPFGPDMGENRCVRSGRWAMASGLCRSAARMMGVPQYRGFNIGFRVAYQEAATP